MIDDKIIELINRDIDGVTSREEHLRLGTLRASSEENERFYESLAGLSSVLAPPELVEPPQALKPAIMRGLLNRQRLQTHSAVLAQARAFVLRHWNWQTGAGFAAGLAVGILAVAVLLGPFRNSPTRENDIVGTILLHNPAEPFKKGETIGITRGGTRGEIKTSFSGSMCVVRLSLHSSPGTRSELLYDASAVRMSALCPSERSSSPIEVQSGRIAINADFDDTMLVVFAVHGAGKPALHLRVTDARGDVVERSVALSPPAGE